MPTQNAVGIAPERVEHGCGPGESAGDTVPGGSPSLVLSAIEGRPWAPRLALKLSMSCSRQWITLFWKA